MMFKLLAWILSREIVANWLIKQAHKTPYSPIVKDGELYMTRLWLFNPYQVGEQKQEKSKYPWFPWNIRIHHIVRPDRDRHLHDHPWNARTFILKGGYVEQRIAKTKPDWMLDYPLCTITRPRGATCKLGFGEYHRISHIQVGGAWTLFVSSKYQGSWGFLVDGVKVHWRKYLGLDQ